VSSLQRLDPRLHLSAAIGWAVFATVTLAALLAAALAAGVAERRAREDTDLLLAGLATQVQHDLASNLTERRSIVQAMATQIVVSSDRGADAVRRHLEAVQAEFPEFAWLGVADDSGRVVAASGDVARGDDVSGLAWFRQGRQHAFLGEVRDALPIGGERPPEPNGLPTRWVDVAAPLTQPTGRNVGVLGGRISWSWIEHLPTALLRTLDPRRSLDMLLVAADGKVLIGPPNWQGRKVARGADLTDNGAYVASQPPKVLDGIAGLDWTIIVRQDTASALAPAYRTRDVIFLMVLLAGLVASAVAALLTHTLTRRLALLADDARAVRAGARSAITRPPGADEISRIAAVLIELVDHLQQEKQALRSLNSMLDARVAERTAKIERLSEEARDAAVTRERLRIARALHDTLAHSLMALLTQIRLVRKLRGRFDAGELDAELGRAEDVATSGLAEARAAITQIRHNGVREAGLGAALQELLARFGDRSGIAASLEAGRPAAELADERAEAVFRIVEEALNNVERHARATQVRVTLARANVAIETASAEATCSRIRVEIADDGVGFDPALPHPGHYGLRGMHEQATLIGARLGVHSQRGQGTRILLEFDA
jgi:signal transduction histidine kinase